MKTLSPYSNLPNQDVFCITPREAREDVVSHYERAFQVITSILVPDAHRDTDALDEERLNGVLRELTVEEISTLIVKVQAFEDQKDRESRSDFDRIRESMDHDQYYGRLSLTMDDHYGEDERMIADARRKRQEKFAKIMKKLTTLRSDLA